VGKVRGDDVILFIVTVLIYQKIHYLAIEKMQKE
jgi:hypothetical protein